MPPAIHRCRTVPTRSHLLHLYAKLGMNDRAAAVAVAYERGLLVPRRG